MRRTISLHPMRASTALAAALLIAAGCASAHPPREKGPFRQPDLVELVKVDPAIHLDIRYATSNDFLHRPVYKQARAFLQRPAAEAVARADAKLREQGFGIVVFDGYRPWSVTKLFWDLTPPAKRAFVADPSQGSRHNRGCAVDLSLFDLATGQEVPMPSPYDDFTDRAHPDYAGGTPAERAHRDLLRRVMESEGFTVYENEWWHFDYQDWRLYPILDIPFEKLSPRRFPSTRPNRSSPTASSPPTPGSGASPFLGPGKAPRLG